MTKRQLMKALEGVNDDEIVCLNIEGLDDLYSIDFVKKTPSGNTYLYCEDYPGYDDVSHLCGHILDAEGNQLPEEWTDALYSVADLKFPWSDRWYGEEAM